MNTLQSLRAFVAASVLLAPIPTFAQSTPALHPLSQINSGSPIKPDTSGPCHEVFHFQPGATNFVDLLAVGTSTIPDYALTMTVPKPNYNIISAEMVITTQQYDWSGTLVYQNATTQIANLNVPTTFYSHAYYSVPSVYETKVSVTTAPGVIFNYGGYGQAYTLCPVVRGLN